MGREEERATDAWGGSWAETTTEARRLNVELVAESGTRLAGHVAAEEGGATTPLGGSVETFLDSFLAAVSPEPARRRSGGARHGVHTEAQRQPEALSRLPGGESAAAAEMIPETPIQLPRVVSLGAALRDEVSAEGSPPVTSRAAGSEAEQQEKP